MSAQEWHPVLPLAPEVEAALTTALRKLSHDISNSLVAAVSHLDLLGLHDPGLRALADWQSCQNHLARPRAVVTTALWALPAGGRDQPRTYSDLRTWWGKRHLALGLDAQLPALPQPWEQPDAVFALCCVLTNAAEALEEAHRLGEPLVRRPQIWMDYAAGSVLVADSGPGCADPRGAASGLVRRAGQGHLGLGLAAAAAGLQRLGGGLHISTQHWGTSRASVAPDHGFVARLTLP